MSFTRPVLHAERHTVFEDDTRSGQVLEEMHKVVTCCFFQNVGENGNAGGEGG